jgi:hypothetical protein
MLNESKGENTNKEGDDPILTPNKIPTILTFAPLKNMNISS